MMEKCIISTKNAIKKDYNIGDIIYAKKDKKTNTVAFYQIDGIPGEDKIADYITTVRGEKRFVDKADMPLNKRKAYIITDMNIDSDVFKYSVDYLYQEDDTDVYEEIYLYRNLIYKINNNRIVIIGAIGNNPTINIPDYIDDMEVTAIGNYDDNYTFKSLLINDNTFYTFNLPNTIKEILPNAFSNKWVKLNFPESLYYIGEKAFYGANIEEVDISTTEVDMITRQCFYLSKIKKISLPSSLKIIEKEAFKYSSLQKVVFNSELELIETEAFYDCEIDTNRCKVGKVELNAFTCDTPVIDKECEQIDYDDVSYQILGRVKFDDYVQDKILKDVNLNEHCYCNKQVFFAKNGDIKYEILIEYDEEYGNDDLYLEYLKYKNCVRLSLFKVKEFDINRHFENYFPDYDDVKIQGRIEDGQINIKYEDEKIVGIKLSERYRYTYEDWVYTEFNSGEYPKTDKILAKDIVFDDNSYKNLSSESLEQYELLRNDYIRFANTR